MADFATHADVANAWRTLTAAEQGVATAKLGYASRIVRANVPTVDARIASGALDSDLVRDVVVEMVLRHLRNPDGKRSEQLDDYAYTRDQALSAGEIFLTDLELGMLRGPAHGHGAFSVKLSGPAPCR